jgi:Ca2+-binding EF-hand superfamily protein
MKTILALVVAFSLSGFLAKAADEKAPEKKSSKTLEKYDKNKNGKLDEDELAQLQKDRRAEAIKKYDKNGDGVLDDAEKEAAKGEIKKEEKQKRESQKEQPRKEEPKKNQ